LAQDAQHEKQTQGTEVLVALDCISKLAQDGQHQKQTQGTEVLVALDCISKLAQDGRHEKQTQGTKLREQPLPIDIDSLPTFTNQELIPVTHPVTAAVAVTSPSAEVAAKSSVSIGQRTSVTPSQVPLFIASQDLLSLPVITLPIAACSIASSGGITKLDENIIPEKSYVTVAAMAMDDISTLPENAVFKPTYSALQ